MLAHIVVVQRGVIAIDVSCISWGFPVSSTHHRPRGSMWII